MSRGPGRIERAISATFDNEPDNAFTVADLIARIYRGVNRIEKKHRVSIIRAAKRVVDKRDDLQVYQSEIRGGTNVYFRIDSVTSYAMARLKSDFLHKYQCVDRRVPEHLISSEAELKEMLASPKSRYHGLIQPSGTWWEHVQSWISELDARRANDETALSAVLSARKDRNDQVRRALGLNVSEPRRGCSMETLTPAA